MKPKKHKKRTPGQKPLTLSPSQAPEANELRLRYECISALLDAVFRSGMAPSQVSEPDNAAYLYNSQLIYNDRHGHEIVSQVRIPLTPEQIPGFSVMVRNLGPYLTDDTSLAWFEEITPPGPGQPSGTKAPSSTTKFKDMLDARDALVAARKNITQRALLIEMGYPASPPRTLRRWLKSMRVSWTHFKQWPR
jgi:hypothetical protein